jgi:hypothetical protein
MEQTYKIVRFFARESSRRRVIKRGLTLEEAQAHCQDRETSSSTCQLATNKALAKVDGPWFDGYEKE